MLWKSGQPLAIVELKVDWVCGLLIFTGSLCPAPAGLSVATYTEAITEASAAAPASLTQPAQEPAVVVPQPTASQSAADQGPPAPQGTPRSGGITGMFMDSLRGLLPGRASPSPGDASKVGTAPPTVVGPTGDTAAAVNDAVGGQTDAT